MNGWNCADRAKLQNSVILACSTQWTETVLFPRFGNFKDSPILTVRTMARRLWYLGVSAELGKKFFIRQRIRNHKKRFLAGFENGRDSREMIIMGVCSHDHLDVFCQIYAKAAHVL
ncbi:hypothetical protein OG545_27975 [Streptomyces europaeiscabiei]